MSGIWLFRGVYITEIGIVWILVSSRTKWTSEIHVRCLYVEEYIIDACTIIDKNALGLYKVKCKYKCQNEHSWTLLNANRSGLYLVQQAINYPLWNGQVRWGCVWDWVSVVSICTLMAMFWREAITSFTSYYKVEQETGSKVCPTKHSHRTIIKRQHQLS